MSFIVDWVQDKAAGYLATGIQAGGTLAGNAVGGVGSLIESSGNSVGQGVTGGISGVGNYINGYGNGIIGSMAADGLVAEPQKKTAVKPAKATEMRKQPSAQNVTSGAGGRLRALPSATKKALPAAPAPSKPDPRPKVVPPSAQMSQMASRRSAGGSTPSEKNVKEKTNVAISNKAKPTNGSKPGTPKVPSNGSRPSGGSAAVKAPTRPSGRPPRQGDRNGDGKVKISAASRPRPAKDS